MPSRLSRLNTGFRAMFLSSTTATIDCCRPSAPTTLESGRAARSFQSILLGPDVMGHFGFGPAKIMVAPAGAGFLWRADFFLTGVIRNFGLRPAGVVITAPFVGLGHREARGKTKCLPWSTA